MPPGIPVLPCGRVSWPPSSPHGLQNHKVSNALAMRFIYCAVQRQAGWVRKFWQIVPGLHPCQQIEEDKCQLERLSIVDRGRVCPWLPLSLCSLRGLCCAYVRFWPERGTKEPVTRRPQWQADASLGQIC